jgi:hypothetical protein
MKPPKAIKGKPAELGKGGKPPPGAKPVARITVYAVPKKGKGDKR